LIRLGQASVQPGAKSPQNLTSRIYPMHGEKRVSATFSAVRFSQLGALQNVSARCFFLP
jgi:hypothetical protein